MQPLIKPIRLLVFLFLLFAGLYYARTILIPLAFGGLLAALFSSLSDRLEKKGVSRAVAALLCIVCFVLVIAGFISLIAWQSSDLFSDIAGIKERVNSFIDQARQFISTKFGIEPQQQKAIIDKQSAGGGGMSSTVTKILDTMMGIAVDLILTLVYTFLLLYLRDHIKKFILRLVDNDQRPKTLEVIEESSQVAQRYLTGLFTMISLLWVMYGIGFSIVGVKQAIFLAILCGLLEMIPFVGNLTGALLAILVNLTQGSDTQVLLGIVIVYGIVQFTQTYLLEPLVVGSEVSINPLFTILVIVVGEAVWGVSGMILAIPALGVIKVICDHVEPLKPIGFLIGAEEKKKSPGLADKIKKLFHKD
ncbi:AI-2E family transporter [Nibrella saemangeumensis]|uniref:AI-2E family transporter n=1 Tax=Nibrella saemangeumensis TaxID=1084526 RepID=UPI0031E7D381